MTHLPVLKALSKLHTESTGTLATSVAGLIAQIESDVFDNDMVTREVRRRLLSFENPLGFYSRLVSASAIEDPLGARESMLDDVAHTVNARVMPWRYPALEDAGHINRLFLLMQRIENSAPYHHLRRTGDPLVWTYFATPEHAHVGRRTSTKPGRYIRKFTDPEAWPDWRIGEIVNEYTLAVSPAVCSTVSGADIVHAYINGPHSCMAYDLNHWDTGHHPAEVYDSPDVALAIAKKGDRIVGRALINIPEQCYSTIYGNYTALTPYLEQQGYTDGDMEGVRLKRIEANGSFSFVMPYLDGCENATDTGDWIIVDHRGELFCQSEHGTTGDSMSCESCGDGIDEHQDAYEHTDDGVMCSSCHEEQYAYAYDGRYQEYVLRDDHDLYEYQGELYTDDGLSHHDLFVMDDGDVCSSDEVVVLEDTGELVRYDDAHECDECELYFSKLNEDNHCDDCEVELAEAA
jgi:hypothetical protein